MAEIELLDRLITSPEEKRRRPAPETLCEKPVEIKKTRRRANQSGSASARAVGPNLGIELRRAVDRLRSLADQLSDEVNSDVAELVERASNAFDGQSCKITVLGQPKSGKSSLLNAMILRPGFLPTRTVPWTAVITRLNVGHKEQPDGKAVFRFFDEDEWYRLSEQGGRTRELAERLLPGFDTERLRLQLAEMRHRARKRLGSSYFELCGKQHERDKCTPEVLAQYVGAGDELTDASPRDYYARDRNSNARTKDLVQDGNATVFDQGRHAGKYADLTRSADVFLDGSATAYPVTLVDTPGANDPFLVREELTLNALEDTDVCVVVFDATQERREADVALLRIIRSLEQNRIVMFVNKIDELPDVVEGVKALKSDLRKLMSAEFPTTRISIVFGSTKWADLYAEMVRHGSNKETKLDWNKQQVRQFLDYAGYASDVSPGEAARWERGFLKDQQLRSDLLKTCSGIPELEVNLSWKMARSWIGQYVYQASATFADVARNAAAEFRKDADERLAYREAVESKARDNKAEGKRKAAEIKRLEQLVQQLEHQCARSVQRLRSHGGEFKRRLESRLRHEIATFARFHSDSLHRALDAGETVKTIVCNPDPLRQRIAEIFVHEFRRARHDILGTQRLTAARIQQILNQVLPDAEVELDFASLANSFVYPSLTPLGQTLTFDLEESWWALWWKRRKDPAVTAATLHRLIVDEFIPIAAQIVAIAEKDITAELDTVVWQVSLSKNKAVGCLENRRHELEQPHLQKRLPSPAGADMPVSGDEISQDPPETRKKTETSRLQREIQMLNARGKQCHQLAEHFSKLAEEWNPEFI